MKMAELVQQRRGLRIATLPDARRSEAAGRADEEPVQQRPQRHDRYVSHHRRRSADLMAKQLINFADPRLIKIVMKGDEIVGLPVRLSRSLGGHSALQGQAVSVRLAGLS